MKSIKSFFASMYKGCQFYGPVIVPSALLSIFLEPTKSITIGVIITLIMFACIEDKDV